MPWPRFRAPSPKELLEIRPEVLTTEPHPTETAEILGRLGATFSPGRSPTYLSSMLKKLVVR
jgi:hypothetical protein